MPRRRTSTTVATGPYTVLTRKASSKWRSGSSRTAWTLEYRELDDYEPWLDAIILVAHLSNRILYHIRESVRAGLHPGHGGPQPPLEPSGESAQIPGRPMIRGFRGAISKRPFSDLIHRRKIAHNGKRIRIGTRAGSKILGEKAMTRIRPNSVHVAWVERESKRRLGEYFDVPDSLIDKVLSDYLEKYSGGPPSKSPSDRGMTAKEASK